MDEFTGMVRQAVAAKAAERGGKYSLRQLALDSGMHWTHVSNVLIGKRRPTRDVVEAWSVALAPHLPLDEALVVAGFAPADQRKRELLPRLLRLTADQWAELERWVGERVTVEEHDVAAQRTEQQSKRKRKQREQDHEPAAHA